MIISKAEKLSVQSRPRVLDCVVWFCPIQEEWPMSSSELDPRDLPLLYKGAKITGLAVFYGNRQQNALLIS